MTTWKTEFKVDDAVFMDDPDEDNGMVSGRAIAEVLRRIATRIDDFTFTGAVEHSVTNPNYGNAIGKWEFIPDPE